MENAGLIQCLSGGQDQRKDSLIIRQAVPGVNRCKTLIFQFARGGDKFARDLPEQDTVARIRNKIERHLLPGGIGFVTGVK